MKNYIDRFKSLPVSAKRLIGLGMLLGLTVALPLFIWAITTMTFDLREKAATGEPLPTPTNNSVEWTTNDVTLTASNFYININNSSLFLGNNPISISSDPFDPATSPSTTLELSWNENNTEMRLYFYFEYQQISNTWSITEIRTYNAQTPGDWISYHPTMTGRIGDTFTQENLNIVSDDGNGIIHFENIVLVPFITLGSNPIPTQTAIPSASPAATANPTATAKPIVGDVNQDGAVNIVDIGIIIDHYGETSTNGQNGDINLDGKIDIVDLGIVITAY